MNNHSSNNFLALSIIIAALLISGSWIYSVGKSVKAETPGNQIVLQREVSPQIKSGGGCGL